MSRLTGLQIFELMSNVRDGLIVESILPSWLGKQASAPSGAILLGADPEVFDKKVAKTHRKTTVIPLWLGKGGWIAAILALLVTAGVAVGIAALRNGRRDPVETETESITEAFENLTDYAAADRLLEQLSFPEEGATMGLTTHTDIRRVMEQEGITLGYREQHKGSLVLNGKTFHLRWTPYGLDEEVYLYDGTALYISTLDGQTRSPMDDGELAVLMNHLREEQGLPSHTASFIASDLFESVTVKPAASDGTVTVVCSGLKRTAIKDLVPILRPMLESLGLVSGYTVDSAGNILRDNDTADGQTRIILFGLAAGDLTVSLISTPDGTLKRLEVSSEFTAEIDKVSVDYEISSWADLRFTVDPIKPTSDMATYESLHWRIVYGCENAEALGLIPDADGICTLAGTADMWVRQLTYIEEHPEEFLGMTFRIRGFTTGFYMEWYDKHYSAICFVRSGYAKEADIYFSEAPTDRIRERLERDYSRDPIEVLAVYYHETEAFAPYSYVFRVTEVVYII